MSQIAPGIEPDQTIGPIAAVRGAAAKRL